MKKITKTYHEAEHQYIKLNRGTDYGIGMQFAMFATAAGNCFSSKFIVDLREWSCFRDTGGFNFKKLSCLFNFNARAIVCPDIIDKITDNKIISELGNKPFDDLDKKNFGISRISKNKTIKSVYGGETRFKSHKHLNLSKLMLMEHINEPIVDFDISKCVAVHARLGNGETGQWLNKRIVKEMFFIEEMKKKKSSNFFVCSDSVDFINKCKENFGDRIKTQKRTYVPYGIGTGHKIIDKRTKYCKSTPTLDESKSFFDSIDVVDFFYETYLDMYLLSKCSSIICNKSSFNLLAINNIDFNEITILRKT